MGKAKYDGIYNKFIKRGIGFVVALIALVVLSPIYLIIALAVAIDDGFPVFYKPMRGGYKGEPFKLYKFRSMVKNADKIGGGTTALNDSRITKVGKLLRQTKLDEIPQLFNVLNGTMSFVGPRPELLQYTEQYVGDEEDILKVRPGITDYSSIEFISLDEMVGSENADEMYEKYVLKRKNELRVKYAHSVSFLTDVKLFWLTVGKTIHKAVKVVFA